jgi:hypothetical protein
LTADGEKITALAKQAGQELMRDGHMKEETLAAIRRPLMPQDSMLELFNNMCPA